MPPSEAAEIDCKVILCLAGGFPSGCADAHSYMMRRITARPPKPPFGICHTVSLSGDREEYRDASGALGVSYGPIRCADGGLSGETGAGGLCRRECHDIFLNVNLTIRLADQEPYRASYTYQRHEHCEYRDQGGR